MANITTAELSTIATVIAARALGYLKANTVMSRLVARDWDDEVASYGQTIKIQYPGTLTVNDKAENAAVTLQTPSASEYTVTLNKHKEVSFLIEDFGRVLARPDWLNNYIPIAMAVVAEQIDADLTALYSGLTQTISAITGLGEGTFREARRVLNAAKAPLTDRFAVLHEDAEYEMLGLEKVVNNDYAATLGKAAAAALVGRFMGFDTFLDQKITVAGGQCKNIFFQRNAFVLATRPLPNDGNGMGVVQRTLSEDGMGLRVTMSYDHDYLGVKATVDVLYGVAELRDNHGVAVSTDEI